MNNLISLDDYRNGNTGQQCEKPIVKISYMENEWQEIKGVGQTLASRLVEGGPFNDIEEIRQIKGIKPKIFDNILEWHSKKI